MARDFLAVPASGVGVENIFSTARDVCHYRRNRLAPETIEAIMIQMSADRFELKREYTVLEDDDNDEQKDVGYEDLNVELEVNYISDEEDLGGFEDDDGDDGLNLPPMQSYQRCSAIHPSLTNPQAHSTTSQPEVSIPQSHPTTTRPRRVIHEPGYFHRLDKGK